MLIASVVLITGIVILVWSADKFVDGSAAVAGHFGMPSLLIGMVIVGFGTSAPEMMVSALASMDGNSGIALGNAYGSNITNIGLILGVSAIIAPVAFHISVMRLELPILTVVSLIAALEVADGEITRIDAAILILLFVIYLIFTVRNALRGRKTKESQEIENDIKKMPLKTAVFWLFAGLALLIASSRMLVWGAIEIAHGLGISDLIIGLTIVAIGTSLPELASSIAAAKKGEHDIALGNIIGSNLFNTLIVVGIAGLIGPMQVQPEILYRDITVMIVFTVSLFLFGYRFSKKSGRINRYEGTTLLLMYIAYTVYLATGAF